MKPETKVGLMVFLALGGLVAAILWLKGGLGGLIGQQFPFRFGVVFTTLGDLKSDAPVKFQEGQVVGRVQKIQIDPKDRVTKVFLGIEKPYTGLLTKLMRVRITSQGFFGDKYINIIPAPLHTPGDELLPPNATVMGDEEGSLANVQSQALVLMKTLQSTMTGVNKAVEDLVPRLSGLAERATKLVDSVNNNQQSLSRRLNTLGDQLVALSKKLNHIVDNNGASVDEVVASAKKTSADLQKTASEIGKLVGDPKVQQDVREVIASAKKAAHDVSHLTGNIEGLKTELGYQGDYVAYSKMGLPPAGPTPLLGLAPSPGRGAFLNKVYLRVSPSQDKYYHLGLSNLTGGSKISQTAYVGKTDASGNIQLSQYSGDLRPTFDLLYAQKPFPVLVPGFYARGGLLEDSGDVGFDWRLFREHVNLQADAYGFGSSGAFGRVGLFLRPGPLRVGGTIDRVGRPDQNFRVNAGIELEDPDLRYVIGLLGLSSVLYK